MSRKRYNRLMRLIRESINDVLSEEDERLDKYGEPIPYQGQGWGNSDERNRQGYNADGSKGPWFSRSCACTTAIFLNDGGEWYVLASERGTGAADYNGRWNLPCGYLDYNEDATECAMRETYEETGIRIPKDRMRPMGYKSDVGQNRQNVCFIFGAVLDGSIDEYPFSKANMEENEVGGIQWMPLSEVDGYRWAFDHDDIIHDTADKLGLHESADTPYNAYSLIDRAIMLIGSGDGDGAVKLLRAAQDTINA